MRILRPRLSLGRLEARLRARARQAGQAQAGRVHAVGVGRGQPIGRKRKGCQGGQGEARGGAKQGMTPDAGPLALVCRQLDLAFTFTRHSFTTKKYLALLVNHPCIAPSIYIAHAIGIPSHNCLWARARQVGQAQAGRVDAVGVGRGQPSGQRPSMGRVSGGSHGGQGEARGGAEQGVTRDAGPWPVCVVRCQIDLAFTRHSFTTTTKSRTSQSSVYCPLHLHCSRYWYTITPLCLPWSMGARVNPSSTWPLSLQDIRSLQKNISHY